MNCNDGDCCYACHQERLSKLSWEEQMFGQRFIVCTTCGCKRCPKATHHDQICTGSNDVGQKGSRFGGLDK